MGRARNQRMNPKKQKDVTITPTMLQCGAAHYAVFVTIRYAEALGQGPRMIRKPRQDTVDISWVWNNPPEGLPEEQVSPDLTVRIQYLEEALGASRIDYFLGPNCPDATTKVQICKDTLDLLKIEMEQRGYLLDKEGSA